MRIVLGACRMLETGIEDKQDQVKYYTLRVWSSKNPKNTDHCTYKRVKTKNITNGDGKEKNF